MLNIVCHYIPFHFSWNMLLRWTMFVDIFLAGSQGRREYQALWIRFQNVSRIMGNMICGWHYIYQILQNVKMPPNFTTKCRQWGCLEQMEKVKRHKKKQIQNDFPIILLIGILSYVCAWGNFEKNIMTNLVGTKPYSDQLSVWDHFTASPSSQIRTQLEQILLPAAMQANASLMQVLLGHLTECM